MAIKLAAIKTVLWPVTISRPLDGGRVAAETFDVEFNVLKQDELEAIGSRGEDLLAAVVNGWPKGPKADGEDGATVAFSPEAKTELLRTTYARTGLYSAYGEIQTGRAAARKN